MKPDHIIGWHFAGDTLRDGRPLPRKGESITWYGHPLACSHGLHVSERILDALQYAPGSKVSRARLESQVHSHGDPVDKWVGRQRTSLTGYIDASEILCDFARQCALDVTHLWDAPQNVVDYLKTGDEKLRDAAWDAASAAESAAERAAASAAASAAANAAEIAAARDVARDVERAAASAAASAAARDAAFAAAWDAANAAEIAAARAAQNDRLEKMLLSALEEEE